MAGAGRELIRRLQEQFQADGLKVSLSRLCTWFGVARRSVYYRPHKKAAVVKACYAEPIKQLIEAEPSFGYRTVAALLGMNKNTVQRGACTLFCVSYLRHRWPRKLSSKCVDGGAAGLHY